MRMIRKRGKIRKVWKRGQVKDGMKKEDRKTGRIMFNCNEEDEEREGG